MKKFLQYIKHRPLSIISIVIIVLLYLMMIFAEFNAPYAATTSFSDKTYHPANLKIVHGHLVAQEARVINKATWQYAFVKGLYHPVGFFVRGEHYKLFGLIPSDIHLIGVKDSSAYPVFIFGADNLGRDLYSRIVYGSRISLTIGFVATAISLFLAILLGGLAGFYGGAVDWTIMRISEFFMLIPGLYLILFLRSLLSTNMDSGQSYMVITLILALVGWPGTARTIRGLVHSIKGEDFVLNAKLEGVPSFVIIFGHIIPQISSLLIVSVALSIPGFIMSETTLSYLGLGIADPAVSWGSLINRDISTLSNLKNYPWLLTPVWYLLVVTLAFNFFADGLRDFFDPYHRLPSSKLKDFILRRKKVHTDISADISADVSVHTDTDADVSAGVSPDVEAPSCATADVSAGCSSVGRDAARPGLYDAALSTVARLNGARPGQSDNRAERNCAPSPLLEIRNLSVDFPIFVEQKQKLLHAVKNISYSVQKGEILGIVGESGSGKSVSTTAILGLLAGNAIVKGKIFFEGTELTSLSQKELRAFRGKKIGIVYQEPSRAFDPLQNLEKVFYETLKNSNPQISREQAKSQAIELLGEVGLPNAQERLQNFPHQFSGGQLQRICIALSLAQNCQLLIADEPTTALDVTFQKQIVNLLLELKKSRNLTVIFISHDIDLVAQISDRILVMQNGVVVESGSAFQIVNEPHKDYTKNLIAASPVFGQHYDAEFSVKNQDKIFVSVQNLCKKFNMEGGFFAKYGKFVYAVNDLSFSIAQNQIYGLVGESGCGKTTTARMLVGMYKNDSGLIDFSDFDFSKRKENRDRIKYIFQDPARSLDPRKTIEAILSEGLRYSSRRNGARLGQNDTAYNVSSGQNATEQNAAASVDVSRNGARPSLDDCAQSDNCVSRNAAAHRGRLSKKQIHAMCCQIMQEVGLSASDLERRPADFSGGQRQRICIARALLSEPDLLICDEVVSALDVSIQAQILHLLLEIRSKRDLTMLFITHDLRVACYFCDRIGVMYKGILMEEASAKDLYKACYHPYTQLLFDSAPSCSRDDISQTDKTDIAHTDIAHTDDISQDVQLCQNQANSEQSNVTGCPFANRCPKATAKCYKELAPLVPLANSNEVHKVRCWNL